VVPILGSVNTTIVPVSHVLHLHDFLIVGAVVVHDVQDRDAVVRRRPQDTRRIHQSPSV